MRFTPEVASKPDRIAKDLVNAKALAEVLEDEYETLRKLKTEVKSETNGDATATNGNTDGDVAMTGAEESPEEDSEPRERGSEAVERRVEKVMGEMAEQGLVDANDEKAMEAKRVSTGPITPRTAGTEHDRQTVVALDLYIAYLRAAFHTCYYCAVVTDHLEELQRKCVKHVRKPLSKVLLQELKAAEAQKIEKEKEAKPNGEEDTKDGIKEEEDTKEQEKVREAPVRDAKTENRDWKRNGECDASFVSTLA